MVAPETVTSRGRAATGRWLVPSLTLAVGANMLVSLALGPFLPAIAEDLQTSVALVGQISALLMLLATLLGLAVGPFADRVGYRPALLLGLLSAAAGSLVIGLAPSYLFLLVLTLVAALGRATVLPVALATVGARFREETARRRAMGWTTSGVPLAAVLGVPMLTTVATPLGWRAAFFVLAGLTLGVALLLNVTVPRDAPATARPPSWRGVLASYPPLLRHRPSLGLIGSGLLSNVGLWSILTYAGAFYSQRHGFSIREIGWFYPAVGLAAVLGNLLAGRNLRAFEPRRAIFLARAMAALLYGAAMIPPLPALVTAGLVTLALLLVGFSAVLTSDLLVAGTPAARATTMTLNNSALSLGIALGAAVGGLALSLGDYPAIGACALCFTLVAAWLVARSHPREAPTTVPAPN